MIRTDEIIHGIEKGDHRALARAITIVENELPGAEEILFRPSKKKAATVVGITGPPGAGKSTLINSLAGELANDYRIAVLAVDPTSPFTHGSLLGDRLRMGEHFNNSNIFIRSLATRGSLGGLSARAIEITDVVKNAGFDFVLIETVGVGQSEVEIASLADTSIVVFVPESGDEIQTLKSGIMEIADIFVINKSDRDGADVFAKNIRQLVHGRADSGWSIPVIKTVATRGNGTREVIESIRQHAKADKTAKRQQSLFQKALHIIIGERLKEIDKNELEKKLKAASTDPAFNIYRFIRENYQ